MQKKHLILILAVILIISGCINLNPKETTTTSSLYKGTKGLELSFVKNAPPSRVFASTDDENPSQFKVIVNIKNKGAHDIGFEDDGQDKGKLVLTPEGGYVDFIKIDESQSVSPGDKSALFEVRGISLSNNVGDEIIIHSTLTARKLSSLSAVHSSTIFTTICYPYKTEISASACIDPDIYGEGPGKKACEAKNLAFSGGQGAPVAVTNIEVRMVPKGEEVEPQFLIHVENKGNGEVIKRKGYEEACSAGIPSEETDPLNNFFNVVGIKAKLSTQDLKCEQGDKEKMVILDGKKGIVKCYPEKWDSEDKKAYLTPLSIVLDYGYTKTISKSFNIEKSG